MGSRVSRQLTYEQSLLCVKILKKSKMPGDQSNIEATRQQVDEVQNIMRSNVDKIMEREGKLSHLEDRADALKSGTEQFQRAAVKIKRKHFWENMKMKIIIGVVLAVTVIIIIIVASS